MQQDEIYARLTKVLRDVFDDDSLVATPELTANDVEEWDSVNHITLVVAIEEEFGGEVQDCRTREDEKCRAHG